MRSLQHFQNLAQDVTVRTKNGIETILTADELKTFIAKIYAAKFHNKSRAKKLTKLSYLLGIDSSTKVVKGLKKDIHTAILYLQPYKTSFGNVCALGEHCIDDCLNESGRVRLDTKEFKILRARYLKTVLFYVNRNFFNAWLHSEIESYAAKFGDSLLVRLNGTSDLNPVLFGNAITNFPDVKFYDYTKIPGREKLAAKYSNYHLTFSYSGYNFQDCEHARSQGLNVSIVVNGPMPRKFNGVDVFSMDETDLRPFDDQRGKYGYLKLKQTLTEIKDHNFVIDSSDKRFEW